MGGCTVTTGELTACANPGVPCSAAEGSDLDSDAGKGEDEEEEQVRLCACVCVHPAAGWLRLQLCWAGSLHACLPANGIPAHAALAAPLPPAPAPAGCLAPLPLLPVHCLQEYDSDDFGTEESGDEEGEEQGSASEED